MKLQQKCNSLERENALLAAQAGGLRTQDSFVGRLVATVAALYNRPLYSDLTIRTPASSIYAHKFVLRYQCGQGCGSGSALICVAGSVADPGCLSRIPDPTFIHLGSRIQTVSIPDPGSELSPSWIPDPHQRI